MKDKLELCTEKAKVVVFNKKGKKEKEECKWGMKLIEEANCFEYLGFVFNRNGNYNHLKELVKKGRIVTTREGEFVKMILVRDGYYSNIWCIVWCLLEWKYGDGIKGRREDNVRLRKMDLWARFLYAKIWF